MFFTRKRRTSRPEAPPEPDPNFVDVRGLINRLTVEQHCELADKYYGHVNAEFTLAKPFNVADECSELLVCFAHLVNGLRPIGGTRVLDFGAGGGWTSHALSQLGAEVVVCDVASTALEMARERYRRHPTFGDNPAPQFLRFDGRTIDLPDASIDRVLCMDAFHHVPNPRAVLEEMGRVLVPGGVAGFAEPGPEHSHSTGAQMEMRQHQVVENDVVVERIWEWAAAAGFADLKLAVFNCQPLFVSLEEFNAFLAGGLGPRVLDPIRGYIGAARRLFFLNKGGEPRLDSRSTRGLQGRLMAHIDSPHSAPGRGFRARFEAANPGPAHWLPSSRKIGGVHVGCHLYTGAGDLVRHGYWSTPLTLDPGGVPAGGSLTIEADIPAPAPGSHVLEFDLVSDRVCWFHGHGMPTVRIPVQVA